MLQTCLPQQIAGVIPVTRSGTAEGGIVWVPGDPAPVVAARAVIAAWGVTSGDEGQLAANTTLALEAERLARQVGADIVVHFSSVAVYGHGNGPLSEGMEARPANAYGRAKMEMEDALAGLPEGPRRVILRIGNVAGADALFANLMPENPVTLHRFADGHGPRRSYLSPRDLAEVLRRLIEEPEVRGTFNLGTAQAVAMADLARAAGARVNWMPAPDHAVQEVRLDPSKICAVLPGLRFEAAPDRLVQDARLGDVWPGDSA